MSTNCTAEELDDHEANACYYPKGGISAIAILKSGHGITDFANATQTNAAIAAGNYKIISPIKAELPAPSPVEGENVTACGSETIVDGFDYTIPYKDFNVNAVNDEMYRQANLSQFSGVVMYMCEEEQIRVVESGVNIVAGLLIPASNKEKQHYPVTIKWSQSVQESFPVLHEAPAGVFA
jgi:hypothetical protein